MTDFLYAFKMMQNEWKLKPQLRPVQLLPLSNCATVADTTVCGRTELSYTSAADSEQRRKCARAQTSDMRCLFSALRV